MSKLRQNLKKCFPQYLPTQMEADRLEQITTDFTIKFFDWTNVNAYKYPTKTTTEELLQIFKDKYYE